MTTGPRHEAVSATPPDGQPFVILMTAEDTGEGEPATDVGEDTGEYPIVPLTEPPADA